MIRPAFCKSSGSVSQVVWYTWLAGKISVLFDYIMSHIKHIYIYIHIHIYIYIIYTYTYIYIYVYIYIYTYSHQKLASSPCQITRGCTSKSLFGAKSPFFLHCQRVPSGRLTHGKLPIYRWFNTIYLFQTGDCPIRKLWFSPSPWSAFCKTSSAAGSMRKGLYLHSGCFLGTHWATCWLGWSASKMAIFHSFVGFLGPKNSLEISNLGRFNAGICPAAFVTANTWDPLNSWKWHLSKSTNQQFLPSILASEQANQFGKSQSISLANSLCFHHGWPQHHISSPTYPHHGYPSLSHTQFKYILRI